MGGPSSKYKLALVTKTLISWYFYPMFSTFFFIADLINCMIVELSDEKNIN